MITHISKRSREMGIRNDYSPLAPGDFLFWDSRMLRLSLIYNPEYRCLHSSLIKLSTWIVQLLASEPAWRPFKGERQWRGSTTRPRTGAVASITQQIIAHRSVSCRSAFLVERRPTHREVPCFDSELRTQCMQGAANRWKATEIC